MGNFLTDRPSSRVLAAPGGVSQIVFGDNARDVAATKVTCTGSSKRLLAAAPCILVSSLTAGAPAAGQGSPVSPVPSLVMG